MAEQNRINLATLQQRDPYITEILGTAKQVALYIYKDEWEKTSISGSLFVYKRSACPLHGVMILNKQGLNNQVEPITEHMEFQVTPPFLLYRNGKAIYGIWFYKSTECQELGSLMERLRQEAMREKQDQLVTAGGGTGIAAPPGDQRQVDILQLLSGAQQRYDSKAKTGAATEPQNMSSKAAVSSGDVVRPTPLKVPSETSTGESSKESGGLEEGPSQLQEIFKKAKTIQHSTSILDQWAGDPPPDVTIASIPMLSRSLSVSEVESGKQPLGGRPLQLPVRGRTVEEIEREIKSGKLIRQADQPKAQGQEGAVGMGQSPSTQELLSMIAAAAVGDGQRPALPAMPQPTAAGDCRPHVIYAGDAGLVKTLPSDLLKPEDFERQATVSPSLLSSKQTDSQVTGVIGASCPDVLLTPLAFTSQPAPLGTTSPVPNHQAILERLYALTIPSSTSTTEHTKPSELTPLTRQQLQQALVYLIRHDDDFLNRIHEAYLASFRQVASKR